MQTLPMLNYSENFLIEFQMYRIKNFEQLDIDFNALMEKLVNEQIDIEVIRKIRQDYTLQKIVHQFDAIVDKNCKKPTVKKPRV
jgi:hypothetical protein